jgi:hypothetical protein
MYIGLIGKVIFTGASLIRHFQSSSLFLNRGSHGLVARADGKQEIEDEKATRL